MSTHNLVETTLQSIDTYPAYVQYILTLPESDRCLFDHYPKFNDCQYFGNVFQHIYYIPAMTVLEELIDQWMISNWEWFQLIISSSSITPLDKNNISVGVKFTMANQYYWETLPGKLTELVLDLKFKRQI